MHHTGAFAHLWVINCLFCLVIQTERFLSVIAVADKAG